MPVVYLADSFQAGPIHIPMNYSILHEVPSIDFLLHRFPLHEVVLFAVLFAWFARVQE